MTSLKTDTLDDRVAHGCLRCERQYWAIVVVSFYADGELLDRICPHCLTPSMRSTINQVARQVKLPA